MAKDKQSEIEDEIIEELDGYEKTGVEMERPEEEGDVERPWDPTKIRVDPRVFSLRQIVDMIDEEELELAPDFQRKKVWGAIQKSRLIESVLLRIPLPAFYFSADDDGFLQVVDGLQRLSTIHSFVHGKFSLNGLEYLQSDVGGKSFSELSPLWVRRINSTQITANVVDPQTPDQVKFDIFRRINTGGSPLNSQEIRHCMSKTPSRDFVRELISIVEFHKATNNKLKNHARMVDREVVLRFAAFRMLFDDYSDFDTLDSFLTHLTKQIDLSKIDETELVEVVADFKRSMNNAVKLFGKHAFRKWPQGVERANPFNRALFDSWSVLLADFEWKQLSKSKTKIVDSARKLMTWDREFLDSITTATNTAKRIKTRFGKIREILEEFATE
jgi:hypothetical protein